MNIDTDPTASAGEAAFSGSGLAAELLETKAERPSSLSPELSRLTQTEEFRRWFGDSKLVDKNGDPRIFYHGGASGIESFTREASRNTGENQHGYYFTPSEIHGKFHSEKYALDEQEAGRQTKSALYRVFLRSDRPFVVEPRSGVRSQYIDDLPVGYDSYVNNASSEVVVFDPSQVYIIDERPQEEVTRDRPRR